MQISLISPPCVEAVPGVPNMASGLARGGAALIAAGLTQRLADAGAGVATHAHPALQGNDVSGDPILDLGRLNAIVAKHVRTAVGEGEFPVLAGGTCSHLVGMLAGLQQALGPDARLGLVWLDAHGDFNTPRTSHSGMLGGMPVAVSAGLCHAVWRETAGMTAPLPTNRIVMVDVRNLDEEEAALIRATDVTVAPLGSSGSPDAAIAAIQQLAGRVDHLYLHVDADILDASLQPNHPTAEPDGPDLATVVTILQATAETGKVRAFGVVSVNPEGETGPVSIASGMAMIEGGVRALATSG